MGQTSKFFRNNTHIKMEKLKEVSAFFPAYNEEKNITKTIKDAEKVLEQVSENYEIIVVDDGSSDKTCEVVEKLSEDNEKIRLVRHEVNKGYGHSIRTGFKSCKYEWIVFTDSDGQFDFSEFPNFINEQRNTQADLVVGYYHKRKVSFFRKVNSFFWQLLIRALLGLKVRDIDCGFKFIRKEVIDRMTLTSERGAFISTEFLTKAKENGHKMVEIPITHYPRREGQATGANLQVILSSFVDLYKIKKRIFSFFFVGLSSTLVSLIIFNAFFYIGLSFALSLIISLLTSVIFNFTMNRNITFSAKGGSLFKHVWRYLVVYGVARGTNLGVSIISIMFLGEGTLMANLAVIIGIAFSIPISFLGYLLWAFKDKKEANK